MYVHWYPIVCVEYEYAIQPDTNTISKFLGISKGLLILYHNNEKHLEVHNPRHFIRQPMATSYTTSVFCTCVFNTSYYYSKVKST